MLHSDGCQSGMIQQLNTSPTMFRLSGISELALLRWHPESVPAMPIALPPWANPSYGVEDSVSYSDRELKKSASLKRKTDGLEIYRYERYSKFT